MRDHITRRARDTFSSTFRALRFKNFRLFFAGQSVSLIGTWMQQVAMSWLVYRLTRSALILGLVGFLSQLPAFLLSPFAGILVDRRDRRRILIIAQALFMVQAFLLAVLTLTGLITAWEIMALALFFGCVGAFEIPARQSFVVEMVEDRAHLGNAIALNSLMFNAARLIGPSVAGVLIAMVGEGACFLLNALSFIAVIASLRAMRLRALPSKKAARGRIAEGIVEGFRYTFGSLPIRMILMLLSMASILGTAYMVLMPVYAETILGGGPRLYGFLMAAAGIGALVATLFIAARRNASGFIDMIPVASVVFSVGLIIFSISRMAWLSAAILAVVGFALMVQMAASNTLIQTIVDDDKRGRVMSIYTMAFIGMAPLGSLIAGYLASRIGATNALVINGCILFAASVYFSTKVPLIKKSIQSF